MKGFRLHSLALQDSPEYDAGYFEFIGSVAADEHQNQFTTLIIGSNGTGKSRLLKIILDIFNDLYNLKTQGAADFKFNHHYILIFQLDDSIYKIENAKPNLLISANDLKLDSINQVILPAKVIVAAYSIYEKFPTKRTFNSGDLTRLKTRYDNDFYEYLGVKSERNYTFSGSNINKSVDLITEALADDGFKKDLRHVFDLLNLQPVLMVRYRVQKGRELFKNRIRDTKELVKIIDSLNDQTSFYYSAIRKIKESGTPFQTSVMESINDVMDFFTSNLGVTAELVFDNKNKNIEFRKRYKSLSLLKSLGLIAYDKIQVVKKVNTNLFSLSDTELRNMSSGEIQILTSMLSLSSIVQDNSLVIIDEPEISLHPNWQIRFVEILNKIFERYSNCHFIIASHSHFLVSDLKTNNSAILALTKNLQNVVKAELLDVDTYGWSAENILYNVFGVATVRNHYFEMELRHLLDIISTKKSNKSNIDKVEHYITRLRRFKVHDDDPLNMIIKEAERFIKN